MPNFSLLGGLEVAQIYLSRQSGWVVGGWGGVTMILRQSKFDLISAGLLKLSLAKHARAKLCQTQNVLVAS